MAANYATATSRFGYNYPADYAFKVEGSTLTDTDLQNIDAGATTFASALAVVSMGRLPPIQGIAKAKISMARARQQKILDENFGYNVSPTDWDAYPSIGRDGSFVSDQKGINDVLGDIFDGNKNTIISKNQGSQLENSFGLEPGSLQDGFKIRKVDNIIDRSPRSPMEGNRFFRGAGNHLPGGAPEMVVDSISTIDGGGISTIIEVIVK